LEPLKENIIWKWVFSFTYLIHILCFWTFCWSYFRISFFWVTTAHSLIGKVFFFSFSHQKILRKEKHLRLHLNIFFLARSLAKVRKTEDNRHRKKWEEDWLLDRWNVLAKRNGLWPKIPNMRASNPQNTNLQLVLIYMWIIIKLKLVLWSCKKCNWMIPKRTSQMLKVNNYFWIVIESAVRKNKVCFWEINYEWSVRKTTFD
jgi:hypothetical protein